MESMRMDVRFIGSLEVIVFGFATCWSGEGNA